jgi:hypothetical protein
MNFHAKALLAFLAFHVIVTGGGLMFDQVPQALGQGANANDTQLVGVVLWALWCLTLSVGALGMAYLSRAAWKPWGRIKTTDRRPMRGSLVKF